MTLLLEGQRAVVVGDDAIGCGIAEKLRSAGAEVHVLAITDTFDPAELDILVCNTLGEPHPALLVDCDEGALRRSLDGVVAAASAMRTALPALQKAREGRIILIGHRYGIATAEGLAAYGSAAWALNGLMRSAAVEWGQYGITTNLLLPAASTPELEVAQQRRARLIDVMTGQLPLGRMGDPVEDIGGAALYLASGDARFVNGQVVHADGGQHVAGPVLSPIRYI